MKGFKTKIRRLSNTSLGCTLPADVLKDFDAEEGDFFIVKEFEIVKDHITLQCRVCGYQFEASQEGEAECPACGETHTFENIELKSSERRDQNG